MGNHYANIIVRDVNRQNIIDYLLNLKRTAFVSPTINKFTVIYDKDVNTDINENVFPVIQLSQLFDCAVMTIYLHDGTDFGYRIYCKGSLIDTYISNEAENETINKYEKSHKIASLCECSDRIQKISTILSKPIGKIEYSFEDYIDKYYEIGIDFLIRYNLLPIEQLRHEALAVLMGIEPCWAVGIDYNNIIYGDIESHFSEYDMDIDEAFSMLEAININ